jgi:quercetin dioxygenase-like cupin family protein
VDHDEWLERAEIYALSALEGDELTQFEAHLSSGCPLCAAHLKETEEALALLSGSIQPLTPPPAVKARLWEQIEAGKPGFVFTHAGEGEWQEMGPGVLARILYMDSAGQRVTALVRMEPGSRYDNHRHTQTEELYVLEGSCYCGGRLLRQGDYHRAEAGSIHLDTHTDEGSLMLVITSAQNEMLA